MSTFSASLLDSILDAMFTFSRKYIRQRRAGLDELGPIGFRQAMVTGRVKKTGPLRGN